MKKISLKNFLSLVYSFLSLVFLIMIAVIFINLKKATDARNYSNDYTELYHIWTTIRHAQHDFLINYNDDVVFFQTEQNKNIRKSQISYSKYISIVDSLKVTSYVVKNDLHDKMMVSYDYVTKVENVFEQISHNLFLRGSQKTGIIGDCNAYYNLAYDYTSDPKMKIYLSKLSNYFLQYLNTPNQIYYQNFLSVYTQMNVYITNNSFVDTNQVDSNIIIVGNSNFSADFINSANSFKKSFLKLVALDRKIFLNNQANLMSQWKELNSFVFEEFKKGTIEANMLKKKYFERANILVFVTIAVIALFFIVLSLTFPYFLSSRIRQLQEMIEPLKKGKIPIDKINEIEISTFTELIEISDNLKQMFFSLKDASVFATEIGNSNFDFDFKPIGEADELGNALILLRDNLKKAQEDEIIRRKEDEIRQWANIGIAKFSDILRQSAKDIFELSSIIIKELTNYLDANQGGIFILNDTFKDDVKLELASSYAYSKERKKKREFALGEGLIGTAAVEKATIYMTDIPEDYISITSGLGAANPRSLLIVPLKFEENVLGVLEIASFNLLERYQIDFVERVAESIASAVSITKINERTSKLLERSNIEAEQRSLKEEELRQNLEELQATQERAAQREVELSSLIELINKVAFIVELDIDGNVVNVPDRILLLFGLEKSEIIGRHLSEFDFKPNSDLAKPEFWQEIIEGKEKNYLQKFVDKEKTYWLNDYIVPFVDASGNVQKFVCVIFDNTEQINNQNVLKKYADDLKIKENEIIDKVKELEKSKIKVDEILLELNGTIQGIDKTILRAEYSSTGIFIDANEIHANVLGYDKEKMVGKSILEFIEEDKREDFMEFWKEIAEGKFKELTVKRINKSTGKYIWLINQYNPIVDKNGNVNKILYLAIDITDQKESEENTNKLLQESKSQTDQLKVLFDYSSDAIQTIENNVFVDCNPATLDVFGFENKNEIIGQNPAIISPEKQANGKKSLDEATKYIEKALKEGIEQFEWIHTKKDGTEFKKRTNLFNN